MGKKYTYSYEITAKNAMGNKYYTEMQHVFVHPVPNIEKQSTQGSSMASQKILKELMPSDNFSNKVNINISRAFFWKLSFTFLDSEPEPSGFGLNWPPSLQAREQAANYVLQGAIRNQICQAD